MAQASITEQAGEVLQCGIVMPISAIDGCTAEHWSEVKSIIQDAVDSIEAPKFSSRLVSDADEVGVIQKRIVQGIYNSDVVVCDVSCKNPNVMFELGMRLAFDKPTVIIKDDKTDYTFDTGVIEHLTYPRDLRFQRMVDFKKTLAQKVQATYAAAKADPNHSTFLKNFGTFNVAQLEQKEATSEQIILEVLGEIQRELISLRRRGTVERPAGLGLPEAMTLLESGLLAPDVVEAFIQHISTIVSQRTLGSRDELLAALPLMQRIAARPEVSDLHKANLHSLIARATNMSRSTVSTPPHWMKTHKGAVSEGG